VIRSDRSAIAVVYGGGKHYIVIVRSTACGITVLDRDSLAAIL